MSHTILKTTSQRKSNNTIYNEITGRLEVYWEQFNRRMQRNPVAERDDDQMDETENFQKQKNSGRKLQNSAEKRSTDTIIKTGVLSKGNSNTRTRIIDAKLIFG